jgi:hypothetical protein
MTNYEVLAIFRPPWLAAVLDPAGRLRAFWRAPCRAHKQKGQRELLSALHKTKDELAYFLKRLLKVPRPAKAAPNSINVDPLSGT